MSRKFALLIAPLAFAVACRGTQPFTHQDLSQVRQAYHELLPTYLGFKRSFDSGNAAGILENYHRERIQCRLVDQIDRRDTIDPNVNLFQASVGLDNFCNAVESAFATWAKAHGYPYLKKVAPARPFEAFVVSDASLVQMPKELKQPAALD